MDPVPMQGLSEQEAIDFLQGIPNESIVKAIGVRFPAGTDLYAVTIVHAELGSAFHPAVLMHIGPHRESSIVLAAFARAMKDRKLCTLVVSDNLNSIRGIPLMHRVTCQAGADLAGASERFWAAAADLPVMHKLAAGVRTEDADVMRVLDPKGRLVVATIEPVS